MDHHTKEGEATHKAHWALIETDCRVYSEVDMVFVKAYELVMEAYRQKFHTWKKGYIQTHVVFTHRLQCHFNRWRGAADIKSLEEMNDLLILEKVLRFGAKAHCLICY